MYNNRIAITNDQLPIKKKITRLINKAVKSWEDNNNSRGVIPDNSDGWYAKAQALANMEANKLNYSVSLDTGVGLYPSFQIVHGDTGKQYTEYDEEGFFKRINGFWD